MYRVKLTTQETVSFSYSKISYICSVICAKGIL